VQANVDSERFGDIDTDVLTDLRQVLQLNNSYVRSFVSIDEQLQSGLLPQSVGLELLACMSLACSLSKVFQLLIMSVPITVFLRSDVARSSRHGPKGRDGLYALFSGGLRRPATLTFRAEN